MYPPLKVTSVNSIASAAICRASDRKVMQERSRGSIKAPIGAIDAFLFHVEALVLDVVLCALARHEQPHRSPHEHNQQPSE